MYQKPNFFIIGAPKCGTTAMASYLAEHPKIFLTNPKEPHYFATDFAKIRIAKSEKQYLSLFEGVTEQHQAIGEASTTYLYSSEALKNIYKFNPSAKVIVMLRSPLHLFQSLHNHYVFHGMELEKNAEAAWDSQINRIKSNLRVSRIDSELLHYPNILKLGSQIRKLQQIFPKQQTRIIFFEDFSQSPARAYQNILNFLGLENDGKELFPKVNVGKAHKNQRIAKIEHTIRNIYRYSPAYYQLTKFKKRLGIQGGKSFWRMIFKLNSASMKRERLSVELQAKILDFLTEDIRLLEKETGRNLEAWRT